MYCEDYQQRISADLDGELSPADEPALWAHLAECDACRQWRRDQMAIRAEFQQWPEETLPEMAAPPANLSATPRARVYRIPRALAWAAAILLLVQGMYVTSTLVREPEATGPTTSTLAEEEVETIVLTDKHRVSYSTYDNPLAIGKPLTDPNENGG